MFANVSRKAQKAKLSALSKEAFLEDIMTAQPRDYQDRNWFYHLSATLLGYPLQLVSILAGSYLLFDIASFVWHLEIYSNASYTVFASCVGVFLLIESLRRWLIDTTGYHYLATYQTQDQKLMRGEFLQTKLYVLVLISALLITSGTMGAYQYSKHHAPQANTINIKQETSPLTQQVQAEKQRIAETDKAVAALQQSKKAELHDHKSYAVWEGKEYLLPETKTRHEGYDKQIALMQAQRIKHLDLIQKYEQKLLSKEQVYEQKNEAIVSINTVNKESYAAACGGIWLVFEMLLLLMLSYTWIYKTGVKREKLLESIEIKRRIHLKTQASQPKEVLKTVQKHTQRETDKSSIFPPMFVNETVEEALPTAETTRKHPIGFSKWYEQPIEAKASILPTPIEVIIERRVEVPTEIITKEVTHEGHVVVCAHCHKQEVKKRPAKYCSSTCRKKHWQAQQELIVR